MALKRKRSSPCLSDSHSPSTSPQSTRQSSESSDMGFDRHQQRMAPSYLPDATGSGRTRKRYRDGRPSEQVVYGMLNLPCPRFAYLFGRKRRRVADFWGESEHTLRLLYAGQRQLVAGSNVAPTIPPAGGAMAPPPPQRCPQQRTSLHAFWSLPSPPPSQSSNGNDATSGMDRETRLICEDCDAPLLLSPTGTTSDAFSCAGGFSMDAEAMIGSIGDECACVLCARRVCAACAVDGGERRCLECAVR